MSVKSALLICCVCREGAVGPWLVMLVMAKGTATSAVLMETVVALLVAPTPAGDADGVGVKGC